GHFGRLSGRRVHSAPYELQSQVVHQIAFEGSEFPGRADHVNAEPARLEGEPGMPVSGRLEPQLDGLDVDITARSNGFGQLPLALANHALVDQLVEAAEKLADLLDMDHMPAGQRALLVGEDSGVRDAEVLDGK